MTNMKGRRKGKREKRGRGGREIKRSHIKRNERRERKGGGR